MKVMYNGSIAVKNAHHTYKCTLIENRWRSTQNVRN